MEKRGIVERLVAPGLLLLALLGAVPPAAAQAADPGFAAVKQILGRSCAACHDWTASYGTIVGGGHVVAKDPEKSTLYQMVATDQMPLAGAKLTAAEKATIRDWILAGAPETVAQVAAPAVAAKVAAEDDPGFAAVKQILGRSCSACHPWTASYATIVGGGHVVAKDPEKSTLYQMVATDQMPLAGAKLTAVEKATIRDWILAGAPQTVEATVASAAAGGAATPLPAPRAAPTPAAAAFSLYPIKVAYHATTGFTAVATFAAAGTIGVVHFLQMKDLIHPGGFFAGGETGADPVGGDAAIAALWQQQQTGRYWHAGLVIGGETLYLGDAITGLSMLTKHVPGRITKSDIHRAAFFTHATLMMAQIALGFLETNAMSTSNHDAMLAYLGAHAVIGVTIPTIMLFAGLENILP